MLDGFIIKGNVLEQTSLEAAKVKTHILKRHYLAISVSIVVHLLLALLLFLMAEKQQPKQVKITKKAIKSYLYKMPSKPIIKQVIKEEVKEERKVKPKKIIEKSKAVPVSSTHTSSVKPIKPVKPAKPKAESETKKTVQATFSAYKQLNSLRNSINEKIMSDELSELQQFRSSSVMHGDQIPVPSSTIQLTPEQARDKRTTRMSDDISITKYDNGICTIERKQFLGSPVEGSTSAFSCGESKFDKSFRAHMQKVRDKIMPAKNK